MAKSLSALPVGSIVKSTNTKYNGKVIRWIVGIHDTTNGRTGLVTEKIITLKCIDAKEPSSLKLNCNSFGYNRYSLSNIDQWLNSAAASWYSARHSCDEPPTSDKLWGEGHNAYDTEAGFLSNFEADFRNTILDTVVHVAKNNPKQGQGPGDGGGYEDITRKVFLLSCTEIGLPQAEPAASEEGTPWPYFDSAEKRNCCPTAEAVSNSEYKSNALNESSPWWWWLRTALCNSTYSMRYIEGTSPTHNVSNCGFIGIRPALYLDSMSKVSDSTDTDGAYILQENQPPFDPSSISYGTPQAGNRLVLSTGGSIDPEGHAISYVWERKIDSEVYVQLGITTAQTFTDTVPTSGTKYTARVKAVDAAGFESEYCTGETKDISSPPVISGSDQDLGAKTAPFTYSYTITDAWAAIQTITVTEKLTNGGQTITLRTFTATNGAENTIDLTDEWLSLLSETHVLTIIATDSGGESSTRTITFSRTVTRIAAARAFNTDDRVDKVFISLYPADIPVDATLHMEVTNNPFDTSPVWVDISNKANRLVHVFTNTIAEAGYGLGYRFYITKGTHEVEVNQVTIRFS